MKDLLSSNPWLVKIQTLMSQQHGCDIWIVGGAIRDTYLGKSPADIDLVPDGKDKVYDLARLIAHQRGVGFVSFSHKQSRSQETYYIPGVPGTYPPCNVSEMKGDTIQEDMFLRDITINACAYNVNSRMSRWHRYNRLHLDQKLIMPLSYQSLIDDPLRILRVFRFASQLQFRIAPEFYEYLYDIDKALYKGFQEISGERIQEELFKILSFSDTARILRLMQKANVICYLSEDLKKCIGMEQNKWHKYDVFGHIVASVDAIDTLSFTTDDRIMPYGARIMNHLDTMIGPYSRKQLLKLALLFHDSGKPSVLSIDVAGGRHFYGHEHNSAQIVHDFCERLKMPKVASNYVERMVKKHMSLQKIVNLGLSNRNVRRFFNKMGDNALDLIVMTMADKVSSMGPHMIERMDKIYGECEKLLEAYFSWPSEEKKVQCLLSGHDIMAILDVEPGPMVGHCLKFVIEAQIDKEIITREEAIELVKYGFPDSCVLSSVD